MKLFIRLSVVLAALITVLLLPAGSAMAQVQSIPLTTFQAGTTTSPNFTLPGSQTQIIIAIDRTVTDGSTGALGLNAQASGFDLHLEVWIAESGNNFVFDAGFDTTGGLIFVTDKSTGQQVQVNTSSITWTRPIGNANRKLQIRSTVPSAVAIAASVTTS